jgi:hypothetical protein
MQSSKFQTPNNDAFNVFNTHWLREKPKFKGSPSNVTATIVGTRNEYPSKKNQALDIVHRELLRYPYRNDQVKSGANMAATVLGVKNQERNRIEAADGRVRDMRRRVERLEDEYAINELFGETPEQLAELRRRIANTRRTAARLETERDGFMARSVAGRRAQYPNAE